MERIIITTPEELTALIREVFKELQSVKPEKAVSENLDLKGAIELLNQNGYPTSKGKMYQLTHRQQIPYKKYCNKLIFERRKLLEWASAHAVDPFCTTEDKETFSLEAIKRGKRGRL